MASQQNFDENESAMDLSPSADEEIRDDGSVLGSILESSSDDESINGDPVNSEMPDESLLSVGTPPTARKIWNWIEGGNEEIRALFDETGSGLTRDIPADYKELDFWKLTFPEDVLRKIVYESNEYAINVMENQPSLSRRQEKFQVLTYEELLRYLAIRINMGIDQKPEQKMYWSTDPLVGSIAIRQIMGSDRFFEIQRYLHLSDIESPDDDDKLFKVRRIWNMIMTNFQQLLVPFENLSVDESLIKFRGRFRIIQFIPTKRNRFGVKTFSVVDEKTGFILNCVIYEGKSTSEGHQMVTSINKKQFGHGGGVVLHLCNPYLGSNRTIYADNYFNSPNLAKKLLEEKTYLCGTLRSGRLNAPKPPRRMKPGELQVLHEEQDKEIMVEFWRDKRVVKMISTGFTHEMVETRNARGTMKQKLRTINYYNHNARGIDKGDQLMHMYDTGRKTLKWSTKMFFRLLDLTIYNAFIMMKSAQGPKPFLTFRLNLIRQIIELTGGLKQKLPHPSASTIMHGADGPERLTARHFPGKGAKRACHVCSKRRTVYTCSNCGVALCVVPCFEKYHTSLKFK